MHEANYKCNRSICLSCCNDALWYASLSLPRCFPAQMQTEKKATCSQESAFAALVWRLLEQRRTECSQNVNKRLWLCIVPHAVIVFKRPNVIYFIRFQNHLIPQANKLTPPTVPVTQTILVSTHFVPSFIADAFSDMTWNTKARLKT